MISKLIKTGARAAALLVAPYATVEAADMRMPFYKGVPRSVVTYYNWTGLYAASPSATVPARPSGTASRLTSSRKA